MEEKITFDKLVRWVGLALLVVAVFFIVRYLSNVLLPFFIAWVFAYLLYPMVRFVQYKLHLRIRALSIIVTLLFNLAVFAGIIYLIIPPMIEQFEKLGIYITNYIHQQIGSNDIPEFVRTWVMQNQRAVDDFFLSQDFKDGIMAIAPKFFDVIGHTANVVISIVGSCITLLYMFFILLDYEYLSENWIKIFPEKNRPFWHEVMHDVEHALNSYIRGQGLVAMTMGILFCIGFTIIDFPMAIGLGILIGILDMVPYLHTFALIPTAFLAMMKSAETGDSFLFTFGMAVVVFCVVQVIIDMVVTPKIMGKAMGLNPAVLLLSLSVWGALLGFIGLIIALPLTTLILAYWKRYITKDER